MPVRPGSHLSAGRGRAGRRRVPASAELSSQAGEKQQAGGLGQVHGQRGGDPIESATVARFLAKRTDVAAGDFTQVLSLAEFME
jgi:hypothetical protein